MPYSIIRVPFQIAWRLYSKIRVPFPNVWKLYSKTGVSPPKQIPVKSINPTQPGHQKICPLPAAANPGAGFSMHSRGWTRHEPVSVYSWRTALRFLLRPVASVAGSSLYLLQQNSGILTQGEGSLECPGLSPLMGPLLRLLDVLALVLNFIHGIRLFQIKLGSDLITHGMGDSQGEPFHLARLSLTF